MTALACSRGAQPALPANPSLLVTATLQSLTSDEQLGALAARKAQGAETRQFAAALQRDTRAMRAELAAIARKRGIPDAPPLAEKQVALRENLEILQGDMFDRGYTLAMTQEMNTLRAAFDRIGGSDDGELQEFASRHRAGVIRQGKQANGLLNRAGGSPFGFIP